MALQQLAQEAAGHVVDADFATASPASRRLLREVAPDTRDEAAIRSQLVALHRRVLTEALDADSPAIDASFALWADAEARSSDPTHAWKVVVAALLQDPRWVLY